MDEIDLKKRLFSHDNLRDVVKDYHAGFSNPYLAHRIGLLVGIIFFTACLFGQYHEFGPSKKPIFNNAMVMSITSTLSGYGLTIGAGMLSVAIAGFAIFATSLDPRSINTMIKNSWSEGISVLIFVYSTFIYTLLCLLSLCIASVIVGAATDTSGTFGAIYLKMPDFAQRTLVACAAGIMSGTIAFTFSILRSFIWNLYQVLLTIAAIRLKLKDGS